jgi:hypothetical protein
VTPRLTRLALTFHVTTSVGFIGAVASFLALAVAGLLSRDAVTVGAAYVAGDLITWYVIVPLCIASLVTGLVQSLGSPWGLIRHYWIVMKLALTALTTAILLVHTQPIGHLAHLAAQSALLGDESAQQRLQMVVAAAAGGATLVLMTVLSIYKPRGLTRYGWRKQEEGREPAPRRA